MPNFYTPEYAAYSREYSARPGQAAKSRARHAARRAIQSGKLVRQPCERCGEAKTDAHHEDYSKPLDVRWLCRTCHGAVHRKTHCKRGHELTEANVYIARTRKNQRHCKQCQRDRVAQAKV